MPSTNQNAAGSETGFPNDAYKMLATKNDPTIRSLVRGIRKPERAREYIEAELDLAEDEDRDPRKKLIGKLNAKVSELTEEDDGD